MIRNEVIQGKDCYFWCTCILASFCPLLMKVITSLKKNKKTGQHRGGFRGEQD